MVSFKVVAIVAVVAVVGGIAAMAIIGMNAEERTNAYEEAEKNKISIGTEAEFLAMEADKGYMLTADIALSPEHAGVNAPLVLDGSGHKITGIDRPLFSGGDIATRIHDVTFDGNVKGIHVGILADSKEHAVSYHMKNVTITGTITGQGVDVCGSIAPWFSGMLENVTIDTAISGTAPAGGFAGQMSAINCIGCKFIGSIDVDRQACGFAYEGWCREFQNTVISGTIKGGSAASGFTYACNLNGTTCVLDGLTIKDCSITGDSLVGGLFSIVRKDLGEGEYLPSKESVGNVLMDNVTVSGNRYVGGLVGACNNSSISTKGPFETTAGVTVKGLSGSTYSEMEVGGIMGHLNGNAKGWINRATVISEGAGSRVGGIVGYSSGYVTNCTNHGEVASIGDCVGGIIGFNSVTISDSSGRITGCVNDANVTGSNKVGGIGGGYNFDFGVTDYVFKDCVNQGTVGGISDVKQIAGQTSATGSLSLTLKVTLKNCSEEGTLA